MTNFATHHITLNNNPIARAFEFDPSETLLCARDERGMLIAVFSHTPAAFGEDGDVAGNRTAERLQIEWHRDGKRGQINYMAQQECPIGRRVSLFIGHAKIVPIAGLIEAAAEIKAVYGIRALV